MGFSRGREAVPRAQGITADFIPLDSTVNLRVAEDVTLKRGCSIDERAVRERYTLAT